VLAETVRVARQRLAEALGGVQAELSALNLKVKNLKSQLARGRNAEPGRMVELQNQVAIGEERAAKLRKEILRLEKQRVDEKEIRKRMGSFQEVWKAMNTEEQRAVISRLVEKVGYDSRTGKVTISFKSAGVKELVQKGAAR
jgi:site-specific DNA recombinase